MATENKNIYLENLGHSFSTSGEKWGGDRYSCANNESQDRFLGHGGAGNCGHKNNGHSLIRIYILENLGHYFYTGGEK